MLSYVKSLAEELAGLIEARLGQSNTNEQMFDIPGRFKAIVEEVDRLDPRDFVAAVRPRFVDLRRSLRNWASAVSDKNWMWCHKAVWDGSAPLPDRVTPDTAIAVEIPEASRREFFRPLDSTNTVRNRALSIRNAAIQACRDLSSVLDEHGGDGSGADQRDFSFIHDSGLRAIIDRDYFELKRKVVPSEAWKCAVIMAGSIAEAILQDALAEPKVRLLANASQSKPSGKGPVETGRWDLADLIDVARESTVGVIDKTIADSLSVIRTYRNLVHPTNERRTQRSCTDPESRHAVSGLDLLIQHLEP